MGNNRSGLFHPPLKTGGGTTLWNAIDAIYQVLSDNDVGRWVTFTALANSGVKTITHNFGVSLDDLKALVYVGTYPDLTQSTAFTVTANAASPKTKVDVTAPSSGGPFTGAVLVIHTAAWQQRVVTTAQRTALVSPKPGSFVYDSDFGALFVYKDSAWVSLADVSSAQTLTNKIISGGANTITDVSLTTGVTGVLPASKGGTGIASTATFPASGSVATVPPSGVVKSTGSAMTSSNVSLASEVTGVLPIASGGTGQTTSTAAISALLPLQALNVGKFLTTDGVSTSWGAVSGGSGASDPTSMGNLQATALGVKVYSAGTSYNGGIVPTVSSTQTAPPSADLIPYQTQSGSWRLKGNIPYRSFTSINGNLGTGANGKVYATTVDSSDRIYVGGSFTTYNAISRGRFLRLLPTGLPDTTFNTNVGSGFNSSVYCCKVQADGKILVGGGFSQFKGSSVAACLLRLNSDGTLDTAFNTNLAAGFSSLHSQADFFGRTLDEAGGVIDIATQPDGKIIVVGNFTSFKGVTRVYIVRLNSDGTEDSTFYTTLGLQIYSSDFDDGAVPFAGVTSADVQTDGKILLAGGFSTPAYGIIRLNANGALDTAFQSSLNVAIYSAGYTPVGNLLASLICKIKQLSNGKVIVSITGAYSIYYNAAKSYTVAVLLSTGAIDLTTSDSLKTKITASSTSQTFFVQADNKILIIGGNLVRVNADYTSDTTFSATSYVANSGYTATALSTGTIFLGSIAFQSTGAAIAAQPSTTTVTDTISGVSFSAGQAVTAVPTAGVTGSNNGQLVFSSSTATTGVGWSFDVALASKPTWSY